MDPFRRCGVDRDVGTLGESLGMTRQSAWERFSTDSD